MLIMSPDHRSRPVDNNRAMPPMPLIDPAAITWHDWAVKQTLHDPTKRELAIPKTIVPDKPKTSTSQLPSSECIKNDSSKRTLGLTNGHFPDVSVCFCHKTPSRSDSAEFGVILECHYMNPTLSDLPANDADARVKPTKTRGHVCGFHVHQRAWDQFQRISEQRQCIDPLDSELNICPAFNFTFCVLLQCKNTFPKRAPSAPKCFCNLRVIQHDPRGKTKKISFTCPNFDVDGAKPKCSWFLWAEEVPFTKPEHPLHAPVLRSRVSDNDTRLAISRETDPQSSRSDRETRPEDLSSRHSISGDNHNATSYTDQTETAISSPHTETEPTTLTTKNEIPIYHPELIRLLSKASVSDYTDVELEPPEPPMSQSSSSGSTNDDEADGYKRSSAMNEYVAARSHDGYMIPSSVQKKQLIHASPQPQLTPQSPHDYNVNMPSSSIIPNHPSIKELVDEKEKLARTNMQLQLNVLILQKSLAGMNGRKDERETAIKMLESERRKLEDEAKILTHEKDHLEGLKSRLHVILGEEIQLRQNSQRRVASLEILVSDLMREKESLTEENDRNKAKAAMKDMKCRVCFHHNIEFALVPCFHCAYCERCAEKLVECAVCRTPKFGIQKIYLG